MLVEGKLAGSGGVVVSSVRNKSRRRRWVLPRRVRSAGGVPRQAAIRMVLPDLRSRGDLEVSSI